MSVMDPLMSAPQETHAAVRAQLLLLADSRLPAGGHAHSGGLEPAATAGAVTGPADLADFLRGRLATAGLVSAALAAAACAHAATAAGAGGSSGAGEYGAEGDVIGAGWARLDAEADARTPSPAQRRASRAQGRALLRTARTTWPHPALDALAGAHSRHPRAGEHLHDHGGDGATSGDHAGVSAGAGVRSGERGPHHPVVLGAAAAAADGTPEQAASIAAYGSVTGPAAAAIRLLGLDPLAVHRVLAELAEAMDAVAAEAATAADDWAALPALSAPALDLFAELHADADLRLFDS